MKHLSAWFAVCLLACVLVFVSLAHAQVPGYGGAKGDACIQAAMFSYGVADAKAKGMTLIQYKENLAVYVAHDPMLKNDPGVYEAMADFSENLWKLNGTPVQIYDMMLALCQHGHSI